jgi:hypothetical protein
VIDAQPSEVLRHFDAMSWSVSFRGDVYSPKPLQQGLVQLYAGLET